MWTSDIEDMLNNIRTNSVIMSKSHTHRYIFLKGLLRYFKIPIIIISAFNSVFAIGLQPYLAQPLISVVNCMLALTCGIIGSIELYLGIQSSMESELVQSKDYYILACNIYSVIGLNAENRSIDGLVFLNEKYQDYIKLIENSNVLNHKIKDQLTKIENNQLIMGSNNSSLSSSQDGIYLSS